MPMGLGGRQWELRTGGDGAMGWRGAEVGGGGVEWRDGGGRGLRPMGLGGRQWEPELLGWWDGGGLRWVVEGLSGGPEG